MNKIFVGDLSLSSRAPFSSEILTYCAENNVEKVKQLIDENANIYLFSEDDLSTIAMVIALHSKNEELCMLLLDVYERDLEALKDTDYKNALVAYPEDQTEDLLKHCKQESTVHSIPLLLKSDNKTVPKLVFLNKRLEHKNDMSLQLIMNLEKKSARVDLNHYFLYGCTGDSFLHLAIYFRLTKVVDRLKAHPTIKLKMKNHSGLNQMHYAINKLSYFAHELTYSNDYANWRDDLSYFYHIGITGNRHLCSWIFYEITTKKFPINDFNFMVSSMEGNIIHLFATSGNPDFFFNPPKFSFEKKHYLEQTSTGMTVLHIIVLNCELKVKTKVKIMKKLCDMYPEILLIKDNEDRLPLHLAAFCETQGDTLFRTLLDLGRKYHENEEIFFDLSESAIMSIEIAVSRFCQLLSEKNWHSIKRLLPHHGHRLLHGIIRFISSLSTKCFTKIFSVYKNVDLNEFYDGTNAYLHLLHRFYSDLYYQQAKVVQEKIFLLNMFFEYCPLKNLNDKDFLGNTFVSYLLVIWPEQDFITELLAKYEQNATDCYSVVNNANETCLYFAARNKKNNRGIETILQHGIDSKKLNNEKELALHVAMRDGLTDYLLALLPLLTEEDLKKKYTKRNETLLHSSVRSEHFEMVLEFYLAKGIEIDVNELNDEGYNLLMIAVADYRNDYAKLIIKKFGDRIQWGMKNSRMEGIFNHYCIFNVLKSETELMNDVVRQHLNESLDVVSDNGHSPIQNLVFTFETEEYDKENVKFFLSHITIENVKKLFYKISVNHGLMSGLLEAHPSLLNEIENSLIYPIFESPLSCYEPMPRVNNFNKLLQYISHSKFSQGEHKENGNNLLHLICNTNDDRIIDITIKWLDEELLIKLANTCNNENTYPYEFLNEENKKVFEALLKKP